MQAKINHFIEKSEKTQEEEIVENDHRVEEIWNEFCYNVITNVLHPAFNK